MKKIVSTKKSVSGKDGKKNALATTKKFVTGKVGKKKAVATTTKSAADKDGKKKAVLGRETLSKVRKQLSSVLHLKNIPYGLEEKEIQGYFQQFGHITKIKLARSTRTGRSKGHGYINFKRKDVAEVVQPAMDNYLAFEKNIKCTQMTQSAARSAFMGPDVTSDTYPLKFKRNANKRKYNSQTLEKRMVVSNKKRKDIASKLKKCGIEYTVPVFQRKMHRPAETECVTVSPQKVTKKVLKDDQLPLVHDTVTEPTKKRGGKIKTRLLMKKQPKENTTQLKCDKIDLVEGTSKATKKKHHANESTVSQKLKSMDPMESDEEMPLVETRLQKLKKKTQQLKKLPVQLKATKKHQEKQLLSHSGAWLVEEC